MMSFMSANRDKSPKVGIFWYDEYKDRLFGIYKEGIDRKPNCAGGLISCSKMHEDAWTEGVYDRRYHGCKDPFIGQYQDTPRGRVFYNPRLQSFDICVGKWVNKNFDHIIKMIMDEFCLPEDSTEVSIEQHWEVGQTWNN